MFVVTAAPFTWHASDNGRMDVIFNIGSSSLISSSYFALRKFSPRVYHPCYLLSNPAARHMKTFYRLFDRHDAPSQIQAFSAYGWWMMPFTAKLLHDRSSCFPAFQTVSQIQLSFSLGLVDPYGSKLCPLPHPYVDLGLICRVMMNALHTSWFSGDAARYTVNLCFPSSGQWWE